MATILIVPGLSNSSSSVYGSDADAGLVSERTVSLWQATLTIYHLLFAE
jgi:hypothetical protein